MLKYFFVSLLHLYLTIPRKSCACISDHKKENSLQWTFAAYNAYTLQWFRYVKLHWYLFCDVPLIVVSHSWSVWRIFHTNFCYLLVMTI